MVIVLRTTFFAFDFPKRFDVIGSRLACDAGGIIASYAGDFRGVRISSLPRRGGKKYELP